jgi:hypothetical protein
LSGHTKWTKKGRHGSLPERRDAVACHWISNLAPTPDSRQRGLPRRADRSILGLPQPS